MTYLIEYLGEFEFIFETILDYESGNQMGSFDAQKPPSKISCLGIFKILAGRGAENLQYIPNITWTSDLKIPADMEQRTENTS